MPAVFYRLKVFLFAALCLASSRAEGAGPGTSAAGFLRIPVGARETSLGGAFTAASSDANAVFYNPAGLGLVGAPELSYSYNNYFSGISQQWVSAAVPAAGGAFGLGLNYLDVAAFAAYDASDNPIGSVSAYGLAAYLGYGRRVATGAALLPALGYGASLKYIAEGLDSSRASGYGLDAGLQLITAVKGLRLGLAAENLLSSRLEFISAGAKPPRNFKAGAAYSLGAPGGSLGAQLSLDMNFPEDGPRYVSAGVENTIYGNVSLRAGYTAFGDLSNGLSFGLGLRLPGKRDMRLDYSYGSSYDLGNIHKFGLAFRLGSPAPAAAKAPAAAAAEPAPVSPDTKFKEQLDLLYGGTTEQSLLAAEYLAGLDDERVSEHFIALLYSPDSGRRVTAVHGLALRKDLRSLEALKKGLRDQEEEIRRRSAMALAVRGDISVAPELEDCLKTEESEPVKNAIIAALVKLRQGQD